MAIPDDTVMKEKWGCFLGAQESLNLIISTIQ